MIQKIFIFKENKKLRKNNTIKNIIPTILKNLFWDQRKVNKKNKVNNTKKLKKKFTHLNKKRKFTNQDHSLYSIK